MNANNYQQNNFTPSPNLIEASSINNPNGFNQAQNNYNPFDF